MAIRIVLVLILLVAGAAFAIWVSLPDKKKQAIADEVVPIGTSKESTEPLSPELIRLMNSYLDEPVRTLRSADGPVTVTIEPHSLRQSNDYMLLRNMTPETCAQASSGSELRSI